MGLALIVGLMLTGLLPNAVLTAHAATTLNLSRSTVAPGDTVVVTGAGFTPRDNVLVAADFTVGGTMKRTQVTASTDANGTFKSRLTVPTGTAPRTYTVTARDFRNHTAAQFLNVLPLAELVVGAQSGSVTVVADHYLFARGSGFKAGETVQITGSFPLYNGNTVSVNKSATADGKGAFGEVAILAPQDAKAGAVTLTAKGQTSGKTATTTVHVVYRPALGTNPSSVRPGGPITVTGAGYVPGSTVHVALTIPRQGASTVTLSKDVTADDRGAFSVSFTLPSKTSPGTYTITAKDGVAGFEAGTKLTVTLKPVLAVVPNSIAPGNAVTVSGSGFTASTSVTLSAIVPLYGGGSRTLSQPVNTDGSGNFTTHLTIPGHAAAGTLVIVATGPNGQSKAALTIQRVPASISVSPPSIRPGSVAVVTGSGYPAGDRVALSAAVKLADGSSKVLFGTTQAGSHGKFTVSFPIPGQVAAGTYAIVARSESTGRAPRARLQIAVSASIALQPGAIVPGGATTVSGRGFSGGVSVTVSTNVPLFGGGNKKVSTIVHSDGSGAFSTRFGIPGNASAGTVTIIAKGPNSATSARLLIGRVGATVTLSPSSVIPGSPVTIHGTGYPSGDTVAIAVVVRTTNGVSRTLTATARADARGSFAITFQVPVNVVGGTYAVIAASRSSGRAPRAQLTVVKLAPSLVASPSTTAPGTPVTANGFGFAAGDHVTLLLDGKTVGSATAGSGGKFTVKITLASALASGQYTLTATSSTGRKASAGVTVQRAIATHFYFASIFTGRGHDEYLAIVNPTATRARVTITYQRSTGTTLVKSVVVNPASRFTESANSDLGVKVSAAASIVSDVPIGADLLRYQGNEGSVIPGSRSPSTIWYFANGNTSGQYSEYLAIQNPNTGPVQAVIRLFPTHHRPITLYRTLAATSRLTVKVNTFVRDAVGVTITSNGPIVANRTVKIRHGVDSKNGVTAPQRTWYFAGGPRDPNSRHWIGVVNPLGRASYVTVRAYGQTGRTLGTAKGWLKAGGRVGYLMNRIAHQSDAAVVVTASSPIVAEQTTYIGGNHDADTDTFGEPSAAKAWAYAAVTTENARASQDFLDLFNPNLTPLPVVVQFLPTSGAAIQRTYVVGPLSHQRIDVGSVEPNARLGILATSNQPFVGLNRTFFHNRLGSTTSQGVQP